MGLTPMTGARVGCRAATRPGTARLGPIDVPGFDGVQALGADEMRGEIAVAEIEPRLRAEGADGVETVEGLVPESPATRDVEAAGQRVRDAVEIRRDVQSPDPRVVAGVDDDGQI